MSLIQNNPQIGDNYGASSQSSGLAVAKEVLQQNLPTLTGNQGGGGSQRPDDATLSAMATSMLGRATVESKAGDIEKLKQSLTAMVPGLAKSSAGHNGAAAAQGTKAQNGASGGGAHGTKGGGKGGKEEDPEIEVKWSPGITEGQLVPGKGEIGSVVVTEKKKSKQGGEDVGAGEASAAANAPGAGAAGTADVSAASATDGAAVGGTADAASASGAATPVNTAAGSAATASSNKQTAATKTLGSNNQQKLNSLSNHMPGNGNVVGPVQAQSQSQAGSNGNGNGGGGSGGDDDGGDKVLFAGNVQTRAEGLTQTADVTPGGIIDPEAPLRTFQKLDNSPLQSAPSVVGMTGKQIAQQLKEGKNSELSKLLTPDQIKTEMQRLENPRPEDS